MFEHEEYIFLEACVSDINYCPIHSLKVVSRYRDPQLQVGENYSEYFFNLRPNLCKSSCLNTQFVTNKSGQYRLRAQWPYLLHTYREIQSSF